MAQRLMPLVLRGEKMQTGLKQILTRSNQSLRGKGQHIRRTRQTHAQILYRPSKQQTEKVNKLLDNALIVSGKILVAKFKQVLPLATARLYMMVLRQHWVLRLLNQHHFSLNQD